MTVGGRHGLLVERMRGFGTTIFSEMTELAFKHDAVNLGQGFPDESPPKHMVDAAKHALDAGHHQYAPGPGVAELRSQIAAHQQRFYGMHYDPSDEVTVTFGATEAVAASLLALCEPGDEVVMLDPAYDAYTAIIALCGSQAVRVGLTVPDWRSDTPRWALDVDRVAAAIGPRTRVLLLNSPHNPTGTVLDAAELDQLAQLCVERDLIAITDEVYEHLTYDTAHVPLATRPGMRERTITTSSAGKTFSCTGWKIGWACAPVELTQVLRTTKQFLSFAGGTPLQHAVAAGLVCSDDVYDDVSALHRRRRDLLVDGLAALGIPAVRPAGSYFVTADIAGLGHEDATEFCWWAPEHAGVAAVPVAAFTHDPAEVASVIRLAFCKPEDVIERGLAQLAHARR